MGHDYDTMRAAAFRRKGEDWRNLIIGWEITRKVAPPVFAAVALGGIGFLLYRAWVAITTAPDTDDATIPVTAAHTVGAVPGWLWVAAVALLLALVGLFWPGRIVVGRARHLRTAGVFAVVIAFAGLAGVALSAVTGG